MTVIGYGATDGTDNSGVGFRLQVVLQVSQVCSRLFRAGDADANVCVGDSGGAVLMGGKLVAIVSGGQPGCYAPAIFTRTDAHADWIASVLAGQASASCPHCVAPDPSCEASTETRDAGAGGAEAGDAEVETSTSASPSAGGSSCALSARGSGGRAWGAALLACLAASLARRRTLTARAAASPRR